MQTTNKALTGHRQLLSRRTQPEKLVYTAGVETTGGREHGVALSDDGHLDIKLSIPGNAGLGTNPEQLFAADWSACFEAAMAGAARKMRVSLPDDMYIDQEVDFRLRDRWHVLTARPTVSLPVLGREIAQALTNVA